MVYDPDEYQKCGIVRQHGVQAKRLVRDDERLREYSGDPPSISDSVATARPSATVITTSMQQVVLLPLLLLLLSILSLSLLLLILLRSLLPLILLVFAKKVHPSTPDEVIGFWAATVTYQNKLRDRRCLYHPEI